MCTIKASVGKRAALIGAILLAGYQRSMPSTTSTSQHRQGISGAIGRDGKIRKQPFPSRPWLFKNVNQIPIVVKWERK